MAKSYNRYEYETSPRKLEPYYAPKKKTTNKTTQKKQTSRSINKQRKEKELKRKVIIYATAIFSILFAISYRNAQIDENFDEVQDLKAQLATIEKENTQLEVAIESSLNLTNLEQQAKSLLGMQKLTNKQTEYVTLPKTDYIESASEEVIIEEEKGLFEAIGSFISGLFK